MRKLFAGLLMMLVASVSQADIPKEVIDVATKNTYQVHVYNGQGSAYYVGDNILVSACHVLGNETSAIIVNHKYEHVFSVNVLSCNTESDLAILQVQPDLNTEKVFGHQPPAFATKDPVAGQSVYGAGYPMSIGLIFVEGHWQNLIGGQFGREAIVTTPAMFGDSGGPAFVIEDDEVKYIGTRNGLFTYALNGDMRSRNTDKGFVHITYIELIQSTIEELEKLK